jgi:hypothetical protein
VPRVLGIAAAGRLGQDVGDRQLALVTSQREFAGLDPHHESGDSDWHFDVGPFEMTFQSIAEPGPSGIGVPDAEAVQRGIEDLVRAALEAETRPANGRESHPNLTAAILRGLRNRRRADHGILRKKGLSRV